MLHSLKMINTKYITYWKILLLNQMQPHGMIKWKMVTSILPVYGPLNIVMVKLMACTMPLRHHWNANISIRCSILNWAVPHMHEWGYERSRECRTTLSCTSEKSNYSKGIPDLIAMGTITDKYLMDFEQVSMELWKQTQQNSPTVN